MGCPCGTLTLAQECKSRQWLLRAHHGSSHWRTRPSACKPYKHPRRIVPDARRLGRRRATAGADTPATIHMPPRRGNGRSATSPRHGDDRSASPRPTRGRRANVGRRTRHRPAGQPARRCRRHRHHPPLYLRWMVKPGISTVLAFAGVPPGRRVWTGAMGGEESAGEQRWSQCTDIRRTPHAPVPHTGRKD